jgi:phage head maturation protease
MNRLQTFAYVRSIDEKRGRVTQVVSTGGLARDDAVIEPSGWVLDNYRNNSVILWNHDPNGVPFAKTVDIYATATELVSTSEFDMDDELGVQILSKIRRGFINTASVRFLPLAWEYKRINVAGVPKDILHFTSTELLEISYTTLPSDPNALVVRADGQRFNPQSFRSLPQSPRPQPTVQTVAERVTAYMVRREERRQQLLDDLVVLRLLERRADIR